MTEDIPDPRDDAVPAPADPETVIAVPAAEVPGDQDGDAGDDDPDATTEGS